ncbi:MAG: membrane protein insertase YidC, partial [Chloroflexota bacterium]
VVQMPILFGLYRVLIQTLFTKPDDLVGLSEKLYSWIPLFQIHAAAPLEDNFLGMQLGANPGPALFIIPLLVGASTWVQQKMTTMPSLDPRQQSSQMMMLYMMPVMLGFFSFSFPNGLSLYWIVSNIIGIAIQYFVSGWGPLFPLFPKRAPVPESAQTPPDEAPKEIGDNGSTSNDRPHRRRGNRTGAERTRRRARRGRGRNIK